MRAGAACGTIAAMSTRERDTAGGYPVEDGVTLIEIRLNRIEQLFSSFDPSPFREKDLDPAAEQYIVDAVDEIAHAAPLRIVVYLPAAGKRSADSSRPSLRSGEHGPPPPRSA